MFENRGVAMLEDNSAPDNEAVLQEALRAMGGAEQAKKSAEQYARSVAYVDEHFEELLDKYPEEWIGVYSGEVVSHGKTPIAVIRCLERKRLLAEDTYFHFLSRQKEITLL